MLRALLRALLRAVLRRCISYARNERNATDETRPVSGWLRCGSLTELRADEKSGINEGESDVNCVLCAARGRLRELEDGHVCPQCRNGLRVDLGQILDLVALAATMPDPFASRPSTGTSRPHPASRPPLEVARIDPELILVRLEASDPSSAVPLLELVESWERMVREERGYAPYGPASALRSAVTGRGGVSGYRATLSGSVGFLAGQVEWMTTEPDFPVDDLASQVRRALGVLRALDPTRERNDSWGIPCPADLTDEDNLVTDACGRRLRIERHDDGRLDLHTDIHCPDCGTEWTAQRLLLVALADERVTVWAYPDVIGTSLAIPLGTLRQWHARGHIARSGGRYDAGAAFRRRHADTATG